ncbi:MAG: 6,7-dimethyl-8-ribityllumazine synthase [Melioribacter sp.]|uniref:6,7-dimethyl-8-ribityllumazine synthase n=1 Tax=Rosettibacter primus TaxID=3111523 RepID=UPI00247D843E|nr:6,7-dimethyl-8-ribityllumazine synthase [Melioribacter sp.]
MAEVVQGYLNAKGKKFAIVVSRFNELISNQLLNGANDCLIRHGADDKDIKIYWVPGSFEIPFTAKKIALTKKFDAVICLGAVIRGATPHFEYIAAEVSKGIANVGLETGIPIVFGIITSDSMEQALERAGVKAGNKGWDAALTAIEMSDLMNKI